MKIGIGFNSYGNEHMRYGKEKFKMLKKHGFSAIDFNMANTETDIYTLSEDDLCEKMTAFKTAGGVFPEELLKNFIKNKRAECSEMSKIPHPAEFDRYYNL